MWEGGGDTSASNRAEVAYQWYWGATCKDCLSSSNELLDIRYLAIFFSYREKRSHCFIVRINFWVNFWDCILLYISGWTRTQYVDQADLELMIILIFLLHGCWMTVKHYYNRQGMKILIFCKICLNQCSLCTLLISFVLLLGGGVSNLLQQRVQREIHRVSILWFFYLRV